jgi:hypothetical protein
LLVAFFFERLIAGWVFFPLAFVRLRLWLRRRAIV